MASDEIDVGFHSQMLDFKLIYRWSLPIDILKTGNPYPLIQRAWTYCGHIWELKIIFKKESFTGIVCCFLILKRKDAENATLDVKLYACFSSKHSDYATVKSYSLEMLPVSEAKRSIENILPSMKWKGGTQGMTIDVTVEISWRYQ